MSTHSANSPENSSGEPSIATGSFWQTLLFFLVSLAAIVLVLSFTIKEDTIDAIRRFDIRYLLLIILGSIFIVTLDSLSTKLFARASAINVPIGVSFKSSFLRIFVNMVTPFGMGGHPFLVAYLKQKGVPTGVGSSVAATKLMMLSIYVLFGGALAFFLLPESSKGSSALQIVFGISLALQSLLIFLLLLLMVKPQTAVGIITRISHFFQHHKIVVNIDRLKFQIVHEAWLTRRSFRGYLKNHRTIFITGFLIHLLVYATEMIMLWFTFKGLGYNLPLETSLVLSSLTVLLLSFLPTPGGSGLGEGAFVLLFASIVPVSILGVAVLIWRLFYTYLLGIVGVCLSPRSLRKLFQPKT